MSERSAVMAQECVLLIPPPPPYPPPPTAPAKPLSALGAGSQCLEEGRCFRAHSAGSFSSHRTQTAWGLWPEAVTLMYVTIKHPSGIPGLRLC